MALNNQTNRNLGRYFFATSEDGEQTLGLQYGTTGGVPNLSTMAVTISGSQGNGVVVNYAPAYGATEYIASGGALIAGDSGYFCPSSLTSSITGLSFSAERVPGSGIGAIESFRGNGTTGGVEFLARGVDSELLSTTSVGINTYLSTIGRPGALATLGPTGTLTTALSYASGFQSIDVPTGSNGRGCFTITDLSGVAPLQKWTIGTTGIPPNNGTNQGSDFTLFAYGDDGNFINADLYIRRRDGGVAIPNISSMYTTISTGVSAIIYPTNKTGAEFGAEGNNEVIGGASTNSGLYGNTFAPLFSTPLTGLNPNGQTFLSINWANSLSSGSNHVNFKVGFSTATAFTNTITTSYIPGGGFTPSDLPGANTPIGHTLVTTVLDPDGVSPDGTGVLYVGGQISDPLAGPDQIFIAKGLVSEATRNALVWRPF